MAIFTESINIIKKEGVLCFIWRAFGRTCFELFSVIDWIKSELDPTNRYHLKNINAGLVDSRNTNTHIRDQDIWRIVRSFNKAKKDQRDLPEAYHITGDWAKIVNEQHEDLVLALENEDIVSVKNILGNFARDKISRGLSLSGNFPHSFLEKIHLLKVYNRTYIAWKRMTDFPDSVLEYSKEIGNMHGIDTGGRSVMLPAFHQSYFAKRIGDLLKGRVGDFSVIGEIGGGYGSLAFHLFRDIPMKVKYISVDIPEMCVISAYFLMSVFPPKKILLHGEAAISADTIQDYDIIILPNYAIREVPQRSCDLVFNSHSMTQMAPVTIKEYLVQINRITRYYFLHANDETMKKNMTGEEEYVNLNSTEYELPAHEFRRVYRFPEIIRNDGYFSPEYSSWEYLYQRVSDLSGS